MLFQKRVGFDSQRKQKTTAKPAGYGALGQVSDDAGTNKICCDQGEKRNSAGPYGTVLEE